MRDGVYSHDLHKFNTCPMSSCNPLRRPFLYHTSNTQLLLSSPSQIRLLFSPSSIRHMFMETNRFLLWISAAFGNWPTYLNSIFLWYCAGKIHLHLCFLSFIFLKFSLFLILGLCCYNFYVLGWNKLALLFKVCPTEILWRLLYEADNCQPYGEVI